MKKKRAPAPLTLKCDVCGDKAPEHLHFGGHCCYSCRAFFRRTATKQPNLDQLRCRSGTKTCIIDLDYKDCIACRFERCLKAGMSTSLMQGKRKRKIEPETTLEETDLLDPLEINLQPSPKDQLRSKSVFVSKTTTNQQLSNQELSTQQQILKQRQLSEGPQHLDRLTTLMNTPGCSDQTPNQFSGIGFRKSVISLNPGAISHAQGAISLHPGAFSLTSGPFASRVVDPSINPGRMVEQTTSRMDSTQIYRFQDGSSGDYSRTMLPGLSGHTQLPGPSGHTQIPGPSGQTQLHCPLSSQPRLSPYKNSQMHQNIPDASPRRDTVLRKVASTGHTFNLKEEICSEAENLRPRTKAMDIIRTAWERMDEPTGGLNAKDLNSHRQQATFDLQRGLQMKGHIDLCSGIQSKKEPRDDLYTEQHHAQEEPCGELYPGRHRAQEEINPYRLPTHLSRRHPDLNIWAQSLHPGNLNPYTAAEFRHPQELYCPYPPQPVAPVPCFPYSQDTPHHSLSCGGVYHTGLQDDNNQNGTPRIPGSPGLQKYYSQHHVIMDHMQRAACWSNKYGLNLGSADIPVTQELTSREPKHPRSTSGETPGGRDRSAKTPGGGECLDTTMAMDKIAESLFTSGQEVTKDDPELIESELFKTAESLINSSFFSYFVDAIANRIQPLGDSMVKKEPKEGSPEDIKESSEDLTSSEYKTRPTACSLEPLDTVMQGPDNNLEGSAHAPCLESPDQVMEPPGHGLEPTYHTTKHFNFESSDHTISRFSDSNDNNRDSLVKKSTMKMESTMWKPTDVIVEPVQLILHLPDNIDVETCPPTPAPPTTPTPSPTHAPSTSPAPALIHAKAQESSSGSSPRPGSSSSFPLKFEPELKFSVEETNLLTLMKRSHDHSLSRTCRIGTNKLMIDAILGITTRMELFKSLSSAKGLQTYNFLQLTSDLPHFKELSSTCQKHLIIENMGVCWELRNSAFFWGHSSTTIIQQEEETGISINMKKYIEMYRTEARDLPNLKYEFYYSVPWLEMTDVQREHKEVTQNLGSTFKDMDVKLFPLVFALTFFSIEEDMMVKLFFTPKDIQIVKEIHRRLFIIYRRFLKHQVGGRGTMELMLRQLNFIFKLKKVVLLFNRGIKREP